MTIVAAPHSLRNRILTVFLGVILVVFVTITLVFNLLVNQYVSATATDQLAAVVAGQTVPNTTQTGNSADIPDVGQTTPSTSNIRPAAFLLNSDYSTTTRDNASTADQQLADQLAKLLKSKNLNLADVDNLRLDSTAGSYYISCMPFGSSGQYLIFYVDVTAIVAFAARVNLILILIMLTAVAVAIIATVLITRRMTRPLADLTQFSQRIGSGDFTQTTEKFHDTEFASLAESMNQAARQLESYDKDQKTFFQNASHELRTPLTSITCYAEGIACGLMEPVAASRTILSESARLTEMVEELLSISRLDSITAEPTTAVVDLAAILTAAADEQRHLADERHLTITVEADQPLLVNGNDKTLHRGFSNLISNAIRYATSHITLRCVPDHQRYVVTVSDDGSGIDPADLPHIFERFYKGRGGDHGIGLAIVKSVVEQHGGQITVRSDSSGTSFRLSFPPERQPSAPDQ